ncbi:MAG: N-acetylmuramoyl-L-alanine amidase [Bacteroidales bacterium]
MIAANLLPLYLKRPGGMFLILVFFNLQTQAVASPPPADEIKNTIRTVVIDAGHGGKDPGAIGRIAKEKDIALGVALKLGALIEENVKDVRVLYTRKSDVFVELHERAEIANHAEADLFISIHVNANSNSVPYGTSSHVLGLHRSNENFDVAVRENSVILLEEDYETRYQGFDPTSLESYIIFSVMQNTYLKHSIEFASYVQDQFRDRSKRKDRGVVQQGLLVLAQTSMPGVLIETGFISNPEEEKFLMTEYGQELIASAIYRAFKRYKQRIEENSKFTIDEEVAEQQQKMRTELLTGNMPDEGEQHDNEDDQYNDEVRFKVQISSSKSMIDPLPSAFKGYKNVSVIQHGKWYKYAIGNNLSYHDALKKCSSVKEDFPGAFVIAVKNNEVVPLNEALIEINR